MGKSYNNTIDQIEVSLGITQLLIADFGTVWNPARINVSAPPAGFQHLGAVVEDTPTMRYNRNKFQLQTGIPMVTQFESVMSVEGGFACSLHSNSWRKLQYALGNFTATASATDVGSITSVNAAGAYTFVSTTAVQSLFVGQQVIISSITGQFDYADTKETRIVSIVNATVYVSPVPEPAPIAGWHIGYYNYVEQVLGGARIKYYSLLGVTDFIDSVQVVHYFPKASPTGEMNEQFSPEQNGQIPLDFNALGVTATVGSCTELIVGKRFYFPGNSVGC